MAWTTAAIDENKRAVNDKYMGPLVKTMMTRCIHCTRCVRFADRGGGRARKSARLGRGENMEITHLSREGADQRAVGQRDRPVPGRRADLASPMPSTRGRGS